MSRPCPYQQSTRASQPGDNTPGLSKTGPESHRGTSDEILDPGGPNNVTGPSQQRSNRRPGKSVLRPTPQRRGGLQRRSSRTSTSPRPQPRLPVPRAASRPCPKIPDVTARTLKLRVRAVVNGLPDHIQGCMPILKHIDMLRGHGSEANQASDVFVVEHVLVTLINFVKR